MKLLVSVRNLAEAQLALEAGVDLLDLKEPTEGSLGATDPSVWREVQQLVQSRVPLSAALGELHDWPEHVGYASAYRTEALTGFSYAKVGLAGMHRHADWLKQWREFGQSLPTGVAPVAVAYADAYAAGSPPVDEALEQACQLGWKALLVDTFDKQQGSLLEHLTLDQVEQIIGQASAAGLTTVLAGSLDIRSIRTIAELPRRPDFVAVRGAVCSGGRESQLDAAKIKPLRKLLS